MAQSLNLRRPSGPACAGRGWSVGREITKDSRHNPRSLVLSVSFHTVSTRVATLPLQLSCPAAPLHVCCRGIQTAQPGQGASLVGGIKPSISWLNSPMLMAGETCMPPPHRWAVSLRMPSDLAIRQSIGQSIHGWAVKASSIGPPRALLVPSSCPPCARHGSSIEPGFEQPALFTSSCHPHPLPLV